jgi:hypothetical protein
MFKIFVGPKNKVWTEANRSRNGKSDRTLFEIDCMLVFSDLSYFHRKDAQYSLFLFSFA